jgi:6,7-dimethyl-8-ribityllumazine synthase
LPEELKGSLNGQGLHVAVVVTRFNETITRQLLAGAVDTLTRHGVADSDIQVAWVPGAFELPLVAKILALTGQYDAVICLGAVIRGETGHYEAVAGRAATGIGAVSTDTGVPTIFGVLTTEDMEQAQARAGGKAGNQGGNAAAAAIETAKLLQAIKSSLTDTH